MKRIIILALVVLSTSPKSFSEIISCSGVTNDINSTAMKFDIEIKSKLDKFSHQFNYQSIITYTTPDGSLLNQGVDLNGKVRTLINQIIYTGMNSNSSLELNFNSNNSLISSVLSLPLSGINRKQIKCDVSGVLPNRPVCTEDIDKTKSLIEAVKFSTNLDQIETAIQCGANVNKVDSNGCTPLMFALDTTCGDKDATQYMPSFGIVPQVVDLLTSNGAYVNVADKNGETPLIKAARSKLSDVYDTFIAAEADFDAQDNLGNTALMYGVLSNNEMVVQQILAGNPDRRIKNNDGKTAFDLANQWQKIDVIDLVRIPDTTIVIEGKKDGTCSPLKINVKQGQMVELVLKASDKMFKFISKNLGIEMMSDVNTSTKINFPAESKGAFPFVCGVHGVNQSSQGEILIQ